ncbi:MAG TPA: Calx-beta domain-containing protein, partial [Blastocatellia bacterium]|nr:Calx-beta domain-containing protein [Blastocatellia bacterium]
MTLTGIPVLALALTLASVHLVSARGPQDAPANAKALNVGGRVSVKAAGRGNPWISLSDGRDLPAAYSGPDELTRALEQGQARPLSLCAADYDEDGMPDLISGYAGPEGGILTLRRGNVDSIYPNSLEAQQRRAEGAFTDTEAPFLSPAYAFAVPEAADFIGAGDFNGDSHWDVVAAARGSHKLHLLPGDGRGGFGEVQEIALPGAVTALVAGEINRRDGLDDVVVGVVGSKEAQALVFEGPNGALRAEPEAFALPGEATALALGQLDNEYTMDLAIAAGKRLLIVYGRDRKLSLDTIRQAEVKPAVIHEREFPFAITALAIGDFTGRHEPELALLSADGEVQVLGAGETKRSGRGAQGWQVRNAVKVSRSARLLIAARVSSRPADELVVVDSASRSLQIVTSGARAKDDIQTQGARAFPAPGISASLDVEDGPVAVLAMRLNADALSDLVVLKRGEAAPAIIPSAPAATFTVTNVSDNDDGSLRVAIQNANLTPGPDLIVFAIDSGPQTINLASPLPLITEAVTIDATTQPGFAGSPIIVLNGAAAGEGQGIDIAANNCVVRGLVIHRFQGRFPIGSGVALSGASNNIIEGNFLGTDITGNIDQGNMRSGVQAFNSSNNNLFGGTVAAARNVISGNDAFSLDIAFDSTGNQVIGNFIGVNAAGNAALSNSGPVHFNISAANGVVGGALAGAGNVISACLTTGLGFVNGSDGGLAQGNLIGTDATGAVDLGNQMEGVVVRASSAVTIGGTVSAARNIISGNNTLGVWIDSGNTNLVQGNFIGANAAGAGALGNSQDGVRVDGADNVIGGMMAEAANVIAFNGQRGIHVSSGAGNALFSNAIFSNGGLGIDIEGDGVTPNDPGDADSGPNSRQNFPALTSATTTSIEGALNSTAGANFRIEFFANPSCDPSGNGEGQTFLGFTTATTNGSGDGSFTFSGSFNLGQVITATATDPAGNTSEFSACVTVANPTLPDLSITDASIMEGNTGTAIMSFTVSLSPAGSQAVTVQYTTADGTATADSDYQPASGTLTFNPGETSKVIGVQVIGDLTDEPDETFLVRLSNASNASIADQEATGTIQDDDQPAGLSITDASIAEGTGSNPTMNFTVNLSPPSTQTVRVQYATADGTATAGSDYTAASGTVTFNPGESAKPVSVQVIGDSVPESNETFVVNLSNAQNAVIADSHGTGTIQDD